MELKDYVHILRQRWITVAVVMLVSIGAASLFTLRATPEYQSTTRLFISTPQSDSNEAYQGGLFSQARVKSYADLLTGEEISRRVVKSLNLNESPRSLARQVTATASLDTVVLSISITDPEPQRARLIAQTFAEVFVTYVKELETPDGKTTAPVKASIVDRATTPEAPVSPKPTRNFALATILGLLIGAGIAVLRDSFDTTIKSAEDLILASHHAPLLGSIYFDKDAPKNPLITSLSSHAPRTESFRVLRTNLQFVNVDAESSVYVVTSAVPGEGKSTTTVNLAITLAEAGERVVLLEADLRRPKATSYMQLEGAVGVTTVLVGRVQLQDALQSWGRGLDVLAAGSTPPNPTELLQSQSMTRLIEELRRDYDIVLIDAPPLLPVADAAVLAAASDGAILVVHHGKTTKDQVDSAVGRLESVDAAIIGTVINMAPQSKRGSSAYGYGYGYGYAPEAGRSKSQTKAEFTNLPLRRSKSKDSTATPHPIAPVSPPDAASPPDVASRPDATEQELDRQQLGPEDSDPSGYLDDRIDPVDPTYTNGRRGY